MPMLHPDLRLSIKRDKAEKHGAAPGHTWEVRRNGTLVGTDWVMGNVEDALQDAIDDMRMLGLVVDE